MAVTAIWKVKGRIDLALAYVKNPQKTINPEQLKKAHLTIKEAEAIGIAIEYATQVGKTSGGDVDGKLVTGVNCDVENAMYEMIKVKEQFGKTGGNTAYHCYQSFTPGEATPEKAHEIGVKLAREVWGGRFQVVVATHVDKEHLHNHFIINSVSFVDGLKYNDCKETYRVIRNMSDRLCKEHGLSVIKGRDSGSKIPHNVWQDEKDGKPTMRSLVKEDVDRIVSESMTDREFFERLKKMGYRVKQGKDITLVPPGKERGVRLARNFGEQYTIESIRRRILSQTEPAARQRPLPKRGKAYKSVSLAEAPRLRVTGCYGLYLRFQYELVVRHKGSPGRNARIHFLLREDIQKLDRIYSEMTLLRENRIQTAVQLASYRDSVAEKIDALMEERKEQYRRLRRKGAAGHEAGIKGEIAAISNDLRALRREQKKAEAIAERSGVIRKKLDTIYSSRNPEQHKEEIEHGHIRRSR